MEPIHAMASCQDIKQIDLEEESPKELSNDTQDNKSLVVGPKRSSRMKTGKSKLKEADLLTLMSV